MLGLTLVGPPSLEETVGGLAEDFPEVLAEWFTEMGIDFRGTDT
jgi:hypothetical protein|tara:strand:+ start:316 stop:447 length:132 start_codon:yes stop_codon:yes gene_type:complete